MTPSPAETYELVKNFRFAVSLTRSPGTGGPAQLGNGYFAECSGLELEAEVKEYLEGGRNDGVVRRVGRVKLVPIVLKRGMFVPSDTALANSELWDWITGMTSGVLPVPRYDGLVQVFAEETREVSRWSFQRGLPRKVTGPSLDAKSADIAVESLTIDHEGLTFVGRTTT